ncbi:MAG: hypothetical protein HC905_07160 [Bacteroidales bacterium]|nr:hypothetical protein [Bacteroidales bacterium]
MKKTVRVLVIEDNDDDTILEIDELILGGYDVFYKQIQTPAEMIQALGEQEWDCIISDFSMPHFSGLEALAYCSNRERIFPLYWFRVPWVKKQL